MQSHKKSSPNKLLYMRIIVQVYNRQPIVRNECSAIMNVEHLFTDFHVAGRYTDHKNADV